MGVSAGPLSRDDVHVIVAHPTLTKYLANTILGCLLSKPEVGVRRHTVRPTRPDKTLFSILEEEGHLL